MCKKNERDERIENCGYGFRVAIKIIDHSPDSCAYDKCKQGISVGEAGFVPMSFEKEKQK